MQKAAIQRSAEGAGQVQRVLGGALPTIPNICEPKHLKYSQLVLFPYASDVFNVSLYVPGLHFHDVPD